MIHAALFIQWHTPQSHYRQAEYIYCLLQSLRNPHIVSITLLLPSDEPTPILPLKLFERYLHKVRYFRIRSSRCTYADWLQATKEMKHIQNNTVSMLINTDTYLEAAGMVDLMDMLPEDMAVCLSRREFFQHKSLHERPDLSQDAWMVRVGDLVRKTDLRKFAIPLGFPGCDNRIAAVFVENGYRIINPCNKIFLYHVHREIGRNYTESNRITGLYCFISPSDNFEHSQSYYHRIKFL